jgi:hydroxymethylbilane synthase
LALQPLRIGTRGSAMALYQANLVRDRLVAAHPSLAAPGMVELAVIRTTGDRVQNRLLAEIGGKGLFTKEIEEALNDRRIDLAVHSLKDMETVLPPGLAIACVLPRDDVRDALVSRDGGGLDALPRGAKIGTGSLRRRAQLLRHRGDLAIAPIRGNVDTRLAKLAAGEVDGLVVALSGLQRLGRPDAVSEIIPVDIMLPAVGQGALAIEARAEHSEAYDLLAPLHDAASAACVTAERAMLAALDGSCRTPIGGLATREGDRLHLRAILLSADGGAERRAEGAGPAGDPEALGREIGARLRDGAGPEFGLS